MPNSTSGVRRLVSDVLATLSKPYSEDVTDEVCLAIQSNPQLLAKYHQLSNDTKDWIVRNWIGRYTAELTGRKSGEPVIARNRLMKTYRKLRP